MAASNNLQETLKPFHQRAVEAEERLARLEAAIATTKDSGNEELLNKVAELQKQLVAKSKELAEKTTEVQRVSQENEKLHYRITHLLRAIQS
ncbi:uncharacterized protein [Rutidosis leptorrhynchoides]|uniref:uncharacterized protein n=1 Tax=Rutidosis leptorrhynchoides TaxID=125765 RepID=UPI003A99283E